MSEEISLKVIKWNLTKLFIERFELLKQLQALSVLILNCLHVLEKFWLEFFDVIVKGSVQLVFPFIQVLMQFLEVDLDRLKFFIALFVDAGDFLFSHQFDFFLLTDLSLALSLSWFNNLFNFERSNFISSDEVVLRMVDYAIWAETSHT